MTAEEFTAFYPQFAGFEPAMVLNIYIQQANARFSDFTDLDAEEARRLYAAHRLTLYARASLAEGVEPTKALLAAAEAASSRYVSSKKVGEVQVSYGNASSSSSISTGLADLTETSFGRQLLSLLALYGFACYVP